MKLPGTLPALGLLLAVGVMASPVGAAKPCSRKCRHAITTQCAGLTGKARAECREGVRAACEANACSLVAPDPVVDTTVIQCCHTVGNGAAMCQVKTRRACQNNGGIDMGPGTCEPNPCAGATTTTTSTTTTSSTTTSTTLVSGCFTDTGDGTIHDTCTGLQWEKKTETAVGATALGLHDVNYQVAWAGSCNGDAVTLCQPNLGAAQTCAAQAENGTEGCSMCANGDPCTTLGITTVWDWLNQVNGENFAGHNDWRLPSEGGNNSPSTGAKELETILLAPFPCGTSPCIDPIFGPTYSLVFGDYLSASTSSNPSFAFVVVFGDPDAANTGSVSVDDKVDHRFVRAVRP